MRTDKVFGTHKLFTGIHNGLLDAIMPQISGNALKVLALIIRQTDGWNREEIGLSYRDLLKGTGIVSRTTVAKAIIELEPYNLLIVDEPSKWEESIYRLNPDAKVTWEPVNFGAPPVTENVTGESAPPVTENVTGKSAPPVTENVTRKPRSSVTENGLSYRKEESINSKKNKPGRKKAGPGLNLLLPILRDYYEGVAHSQREILAVANQAETLHQEGITPDQLNAFLKQRREPPSPGFIGIDYRKWEKGLKTAKAQTQAKSNVGRAVPANGKAQTAANGQASLSQNGHGQANLTFTRAQLAGRKNPKFISQWDQVLAALSTSVNAESLSTWFKPMAIVAREGGILILSAPDAVFEDWVMNNYYEVLESGLEAAGLKVSSVRFVFPTIGASE